jgi:hypothetical protein
MRPHLGHVEDVEPVALTFTFWHDLNIPSPRGSVALGDMVIEVLCSIVLA